MKKIMQFLSLPIIALVLTACGNSGSAPETTTTMEVTTVAPATTTETQVSTPNDVTTTNESETSGSESNTNNTDESLASDIAAEDVKFTIYVNGEKQQEFVAKNAVGGSVLEAMENIEGLDFIFDENEGIISSIDNIDNNYENNETWVYLLNGQYAEYGVVSQKLAEGDEIEWYFGTAEELPVNIIPATE